MNQQGVLVMQSCAFGELLEKSKGKTQIKYCKPSVGYRIDLWNIYQEKESQKQKAAGG
jgi:hypothetical protein